MSPRTKKPRICSCPIKGRAFKPAGMPLSGVGKVFMRREEILAEARRKTAEALSECKAIILDETICR
jgi:predicted DNA-binding protein (UPF0251 family)